MPYIPLRWMAKMTFARAVASLSLVLASASVLPAQTITSALDPKLTGSSRVDFESGVTGLFNVGTWNGVTFSTPRQGEAFHVDGSYAGDYNSRDRYSLQNQYDLPTFSLLNIDFNGPVSAFGFLWGASDDQWTLSAFDSGDNLLSSYMLPITKGSNAGDFVGLWSSTANIVRAELTGPSSDYIFVDNLDFVASTSTVPEPASVILLGGGLAALLFAARRRTQRVD